MDTELFNFLTTQGVFALLFGYLLFYILKQNQIREENYQKIIQQLNEVLPTIKNDLEDIKADIKKLISAFNMLNAFTFQFTCCSILGLVITMLFPM